MNLPKADKIKQTGATCFSLEKLFLKQAERDFRVARRPC